MAYVMMGLIIAVFAITKTHNTEYLNTQDYLTILGGFIMGYGVVMMVWNYAAGARKWWL